MTPDLSSPVSVAKQCAQAALPVMDIVKRHVSRMLQAFGGVQNPLLHMGEEGFKDIVTLSETMRTLFNSTREVMECQEHSKESLEMVKAERQAALQAEVEENCKFLDMSTERDDSSAPPLPSPAVLSRFLEKAGRFSEHDDDDEDEDGHLRVIIELNKDDDLGLKELFGVADEPSSTSAAAAAGASSSSSADVIVLDGGEGQGQGNRATEAAEVELKGAKKPQVSLDKDAESRAALEKALGLDELPEVTQQSPEPAFVLETSFDGLEYPEQVPYTPDQRLALHSSIANGCVTLVAKFATDLHANRLRGHGAERRTKTLQDRCCVRSARGGGVAGVPLGVGHLLQEGEKDQGRRVQRQMGAAAFDEGPFREGDPASHRQREDTRGQPDRRVPCPRAQGGSFSAAQPVGV